MTEHFDSVGFVARLKTAIGFEPVYKFAQRCGITESVFRKYLKGNVMPGLESLVSIAKEAEINLDWLIFEKGLMRGGHEKAEPAFQVIHGLHPFNNTPENGIFCAEFGKNLKTIRERKGEDFFQARTSLDLSVEEYSALENGYLPSADFLFNKLARHFNCRPGELLYGPHFTPRKHMENTLTISESNAEKIFAEEDNGLAERLFGKLPTNAKYEGIMAHIQCFNVLDDSMNPTFNKNDVVIIGEPPNFNNIYLHTGLFIFNMRSQTILRRAAERAKDKVLLSCDNEFYSSELIDAEEFDKCVAGQVIGAIKLYSQEGI